MARLFWPFSEASFQFVQVTAESDPHVRPPEEMGKSASFCKPDRHRFSSGTCFRKEDPRQARWRCECRHCGSSSKDAQKPRYHSISRSKEGNCSPPGLLKIC